MKSINLLPEDYRTRRAFRRRARAWAQVLIVAGATASMTIAVCLSVAPATSDLQTRIAVLRAESDRLVRLAGQQADEFARTQQRVGLLNSVARQPDWSRLLSLVGQWCTDGIRLESVTIQASRAQPRFEMNIFGMCTSQDLASVYVECARASGLFDSITLAGTRRVEHPDGPMYRFELRCTIAGLTDQAEAIR